MSATRKAVHFGDFMEDVYGFAQAVQSGDTIYVAGQTAFAADGTIGGGADMAGQMRAAYVNVARVLEQFGATMRDVVDETLFAVDGLTAGMVAKDVRREFYGDDFAVASTLCEVRALGTPELLIEIKCIARIDP